MNGALSSAAGGALPGILEPGLTWVNPFTDRLRTVNMQITVAVVPGQETITRDNVTMRVDAVVYYRVVDPVKAIVNVQDYGFAVAQVAQTSLRAVTGRSDMDRLLAEREKVNAELKDVIDEPTEQPWGIRVERVEVKDVSLPEAMKRSMSRQAEAERERRARVIGADGEYQAARKLAQAASVLGDRPSRLAAAAAADRRREEQQRHHRACPGGGAALPRPCRFGGWPGPSLSGASPAPAGRSGGSWPGPECWPAVSPVSCAVAEQLPAAGPGAGRWCLMAVVGVEVRVRVTAPAKF
jgi:regulator of protease activity HflC (stomatin/prohibitin superfamily)